MAMPIKDWRDFPDGSTPINAAVLEDLEARLASWAEDAAMGGYRPAGGAIAPFSRYLTNGAGSGSSGGMYSTLCVVPADRAGSYTKVRVQTAGVGSGVTGFRIGVYDWLLGGPPLGQTADQQAGLSASTVQTFSLTSTVVVTAGQILTLALSSTFTTTAPSFHGRNWPNAAHGPFIDVGAQTGIPVNVAGHPGVWSGVGTSLPTYVGATKTNNSSFQPFIELVP